MFFTVCKCWASSHIWTNRVPSPPPAAAAAAPRAHSSSICASDPECRAASSSSSAQSHTANRSQCLKSGMSAHISHLTPSTASCWLLPLFSVDFHLSGQSMDLLWFWKSVQNRLDCCCCCCGCKQRRKAHKKNRGDVSFAQGASISRLFRTGCRFDYVLREKVSAFVILWEVKVIARVDWQPEPRWCPPFFLMLSFQRQWTGEHVFREGDGG